MTGTQHSDGAADYYVPRHAAWLASAAPDDDEMADNVTEPIAPQPVTAASMAASEAAPPHASRFWRGRKRDSSQQPVASA